MNFLSFLGEDLPSVSRERQQQVCRIAAAANAIGSDQMLLVTLTQPYKANALLSNTHTAYHVNRRKTQLDPLSSTIEQPDEGK